MSNPYLDFGHEALDEVLVDDAVGGGEEGEHVRDEVALVLLQVLPVVVVLIGERCNRSSKHKGYRRY